MEKNEPPIHQSCSTPLSAEDASDPANLEAELEALRAFSGDIVYQRHLLNDLEALTAAADAELNSAAGASDNGAAGDGADAGSAVSAMKEDTNALKDKLDALTSALNKKTAETQSALVTAQGTKGAVGALGSWLKDAESLLERADPPATDKAALDRQKADMRLFLDDLAAHAPAVTSLKDTALAAASSPLSPVMEQEIAKIDERFKRLHDAANDRNQALEEVDGRLDALTDAKTAMEAWADGVVEALDSKEDGGLGGVDGGMEKEKERLEEWKRELDGKKEQLKKMEEEVAMLKGAEKCIIQTCNFCCHIIN